MRHSTRSRGWFVGFLACWIAAAACPGRAEEAAWRFLDALRNPQRPYYDMALAYLERMQTSPLCPDDLKEQIDYQVGITLVASSRLGGARRQQLDDAHDALERFLGQHPDHPLAADARVRLANVLVEQGKIKVEAASRPSKSAEEKKRLLAEARTQYQDAQKVFVEAESRVRERLKELEEEAKKDSSKTAERDQARTDFLDAKLYLADIVYEIGKTYGPGSEQFKKQLAEAAAQYADLYEDYHQLGGTLLYAGLYARVQEGRVYNDLGEADKAAKALKQLRAVLSGAGGSGRRLSNQALGVLLEAYLLPGAKKYSEAVAEAAKWLDATRGAEESSPEGLKIRFLAGRAALANAGELKKGDAKQRESLKTARQHFEFVSRFPGELQREAKTMLASEALGGEGQTGEPQTFEEAKDRGDFAWDTMLIALADQQQPGAAEETAKATAELEQARDEAIRYYHMALGLKTAETPVPELNLIRLRMANLYLIRQDYYRSAVLGEFLARQYPESLGARQGALIAVESYRALYLLSPAPKEERTFEIEHLNAIAEYTTTLWPDQPEANEARKALLDTAVDNRDLDKAQQYLAKIPPESPQRAQAELRTGQALWALYVEESQRPEGERPPQEKLDAWLAKAQETLEQGIARARKSVDEGGQVDYRLVYSVWVLAQMDLGAGKSKEAVQRLEDPKIGPLTLVAAKDPVTDRGNFRIQVYRSALWAYVGAQELDKAEKTMDDLETLVAAGGDAAAAEKLTIIYFRLGRELQETLKRLRQESKTEEADRVQEGFELFLERVSERETGNTYNSLLWVAETFYSLGAGLDSGEETPEEAVEHYTSAARAYLSILNQIKADETGEFAPADAETNIQVRLAMCLRALDQHEDALNKILIKILKQRENHVDVQVEAARTYQDWAAMKGHSDKYLTAIRGAEVDGRYLVWGWSGISRRVARFPQFQDVFHEARYNLALCRFLLAQAGPKAERKGLLKQAELDVTRIHQLYPKMGGDESYRKYDDLLKKIQKAQGVRDPRGLGGRPKAAAPAK